MSTVRRRKVSIPNSGKRKKRKKYCCSKGLDITSDEISSQFQIMRDSLLQELEIYVQSAKNSDSTHSQNSNKSAHQVRVDTDDVLSLHEITDYKLATPGR